MRINQLNRGPFLEVPENFLHPVSRSRISNFMLITKLSYSHIVNKKRGKVSGVYTSQFLDTDELKMALGARKVSGAFEKRAVTDIDYQLGCC